MVKLALVNGKFDSECNRLTEMLPESFAMLADLYLTQTEHQKALHVLEKYNEQFPKYPTGYFLLGKIHYKQDDKEKALKYLQKVLQIIPEHPAALELISRIYMDNGDEAIARSYLNQIRQNDKLYGLEFNTESICKKTDKKMVRPAKIKREGFERLQENFATETMLNLYLNQGHKQLAKELCNNILVSQPDNNRVKRILEELEN